VGVAIVALLSIIALCAVIVAAFVVCVWAAFRGQNVPGLVQDLFSLAEPKVKKKVWLNGQ